MNDLAGAVIVLLCVHVAYLWLRLRILCERQNNDAKYFDWWMRSMEERKEDKPDLTNAEYVDGPD